MDLVTWLPAMFFPGFMAMTLCALLLDACERLGGNHELSLSASKPSICSWSNCDLLWRICYDNTSEACLVAVMCPCSLDGGPDVVGVPRCLAPWLV
jgi:hypothetical protein